jgi:hypothetical protein
LTSEQCSISVEVPDKYITGVANTWLRLGKRRRQEEEFQVAWEAFMDEHDKQEARAPPKKAKRKKKVHPAPRSTRQTRQ